MMYITTFSAFLLHFKLIHLYHHLVQHICSLGYRQPLVVAYDLLFLYKIVNYIYIKLNKYMQMLQCLK